MERKLLLLGLLRKQVMHGYQLNELIDKHIDTDLQLTKSTAYRILQKMTEDNWIDFSEIQDGKRPVKRIYSITPEGEQQFQKLLRKTLSKYDPIENRNLISLIFLDVLPLEEAILLLEKRGTSIKNLILKTHTEGKMPDHGQFGLLIDNRIRHLNTELEWLNEVITHLKKSKKQEKEV